MRLTYVASSLLCVFLASCNTAPVKPESLNTLSISQIQQIQSFDELVAMRANLASGLSGKDVADYAADYAALAQIDTQIVDIKKAEITALLASKQLDSGVVPLNVLGDIKNKLEANTVLPTEKWAPVLSIVNTETTKTNEFVADLESKANAEVSVEKQIVLFNKLHKVTGDDAWQAKRDNLVEGLIASIREAAKAETFDENILEKVAVIKSTLGDNTALYDEMVGVDAKVYEKRFFDALGEGKADMAYKILSQMSTANDFPAIKSKLAPTSQKMAEYFTALADESVKTPKNVGQSYRWYNQAREVRSILGLAQNKSADRSALTDQLYKKYLELAKNNEEAAALAHLYAIKTFQPNRSGLRKILNTQENAVRDLAVKRISTTDFQSPYKDQDYGDVISSFITQYLFEHVPHDVRIVEREQYEAILRERGLSGDTSSLSSVNLLVSGSVLESKVDSSEAKNKKMMRVEVGNETIANPNYISWLELPSKERKKIDQPSETMTVSKHENISVGVTRHRKVGLFSVSYRLVEASSGRVVFPDSITTSNEYEDESSEGVEMGDFVIPFKLADLPSDVKILDELARKVATEIGEKLVNELKDQDQKYLKKASKFAEQNDCIGEVSELGSALMILRLKNLDESAVLPQFQNKGVACFN